LPGYCYLVGEHAIFTPYFGKKKSLKPKKNLLLPLNHRHLYIYMTTPLPIRAMLIGAGPMGINIYKLSLKRKDILITQVVDINPALQGKDMGQHAELDATGVIINDRYDQLTDVQVAILATVSDLQGISPQLIGLIDLGLPVVSTCEELFFPWENDHELSASIDLAAREKGVAVLGTGVNPGFLMDALPTMFTALCNEVERIEVRRYQDAQFRRVPFQKKIGAGLSLEEFERRKEDGSLRHVGLTESMYFIARQLGWKLDSTADNVEPVIALRNIEISALNIVSGQASGVRQTGIGMVNGEEKIKLTFQATVGEPESYDEIEIFGTPHIRSRIMKGIHGDIATCAIILNACKSILKASPGLRTMADIPLISSTGI
jgi:hypothetical protein